LPNYLNKCLKIIELTKNELQQAVFHLKLANKSLKRNIDFNNVYILNLLCKNYYQIKYTRSVYAVGYFESKQKENLKKVNIKGGTAWAIQMFVDKSYKTQNLPIYFFCQDSNSWWNCAIIFNYNGEKIINWEKMYLVPKPINNYTAIGSRSITENGKQAIKQIFS